MLWEGITQFCRFTFFILQCTSGLFNNPSYISGQLPPKACPKASLQSVDLSLPNVCSRIVLSANVLASSFLEMEVAPHEPMPTHCHVVDISLSVVSLYSSEKPLLSGKRLICLPMLLSSSLISHMWTCPFNVFSHMPLLHCNPFLEKMRPERAFPSYATPTQSLSFLSLASSSCKQ